MTHSLNDDAFLLKASNQIIAKKQDEMKIQIYYIFDNEIIDIN